MDGMHLSSDQIFAELIGMGFEFSDATEAIKAVGLSLEDAVEFILNGPRRSSAIASSSSSCHTSNGKTPGRKALSASCLSDRMRQSTIVEHLQCAGRLKRKKTHLSVSRSQVLPKPAKGSNEVFHAMESNMETTPETFMLPPSCQEEVGIGPGWEHKVNDLLQKRFGYSSLKQFQKDALAAWLAHQDCLVLAATGSGKSLCFQIPALLSGKVVVVISPLISLMYDQCVKLAKHGVSACFLGSGQPDSSIEKKAMRGMYDIIYVCPETILRLIKPLQGLAESRGIALFAIDEVHCISKWGHDFRPDYRRLSVLRENFRADGLKFLRFDIPLMALTATATLHVREDILKSLCMSSDTKIVLTSFFRPNLQFSVQHSRTSSPSSYEKDFRELISIYSKKKMSDKKKHDAMLQELEYGSDSSSNTSKESLYKADTTSQSDLNNIEDDAFFENDDDGISLTKANWSTAPNEKKLSVEYLEDESDMLEGVDDLDVPCGEFFGQSLDKESNICGSSLIYDIPNKQGEGLELWEGHLEEGPTIIYVPTRKETLSIAKFLCKFGVRAAAYNAKLPKVQLRQVHMDFHENALEVVVATIAFGMGIDKLNVRRIIHYGWPQSLEAYYQEAGRAGRDGKLAHCILYADLSRIPSLLPSQRSKEQTEHAYKMLSDCFRYGMNTSSCRAKTLVEYFGETFSNEICKMCDVCVNGPPKMLNLKAEADVFMHVIAAHYGQVSSGGSSYDNVISVGNKQGRQLKPNIRMFVTKIREQFQKFLASDVLWWRGFSRILEDKGFIREVDDMIRVQIKFPEPTQQGLEFLQGKGEQPFYVYPEADMLLSQRNDKPYSSFSEWGKGWADPDIRRQRLQNIKGRRNPRKRKSRKFNRDPRTVRGRLAAKLSK